MAGGITVFILITFLTISLVLLITVSLPVHPKKSLIPLLSYSIFTFAIASILHWTIAKILPITAQHSMHGFFKAYILGGLLEETCRWLGLRFIQTTTRRQKSIQFILFGMVFALLENAFYLISHPSLAVFLLRFTGALPLHILASLFIAHLPKGWIWAVVLHGSYNWLIVLGAPWFLLVLLIAMATMAIVVRLSYLAQSSKISFF
jgi:hypothetical protein